MILILTILTAVSVYLAVACLVGHRLRTRTVSIEDAHAMVDAIGDPDALASRDSVVESPSEEPSVILSSELVTGQHAILT